MYNSPLAMMPFRRRLTQQLVSLPVLKKLSGFRKASISVESK